LLIEDYLYYVNYRNQLTQFILFNCCITPHKKKQGRTNLSEHEVLGLLKELTQIEILIKNG